MTPDDVRAKLDELRGGAGDPEFAHADEDRLWEDVLATIAGGCDNPAELASLALQSKDIDFPRWYA